jgi:protein-S-isoprenylcysteine O-methyltransferase Ste14
MKARKILPPTLFWIVLAVMVLLRLLFPVMIVLRFPFTLNGLVPLLTGFVMMMTAWDLFREERTNLNTFSSPGTFVQRGPYRFSRNPIYMGLLLMLIGAWLLLGALSPGLGVIAFSFWSSAGISPSRSRKCWPGSARNTGSLSSLHAVVDLTRLESVKIEVYWL